LQQKNINTAHFPTFSDLRFYFILLYLFIYLFIHLFIHSFIFFTGFDNSNSFWSEWSECPNTCSGGTQTRLRTCSDDPELIDDKNCTVFPQTRKCRLDPFTTGKIKNSNNKSLNKINIQEKLIIRGILDIYYLFVRKEKDRNNKHPNANICFFNHVLIIVYYIKNYDAKKS